MARSCPGPEARWRAVKAASLALLAAACAAPQPKGPILLHPVPPVAERYSLARGALVFSGPEFTVTARPWDGRLVEEEFRLSGEPDPFGGTEGDAGGFLFFRVRFENRSGRTLVFNPLRAALWRSGEAPLTPLENSDHFAFAGGDATAETRARAFRRVCFDGTTTLRPDQALERYLVFPSPPGWPGARRTLARRRSGPEVTLAIDDLWLGTESHDLRFVFEVFPGK
jgi:hypothetical protein